MESKKLRKIILASALASVMAVTGVQTAFAAQTQQTSQLAVEDLTLQPGADTTQINLNWYAVLRLSSLTAKTPSRLTPPHSLPLRAK